MKKRKLRKEIKWFIVGFITSQVLQIGLNTYNSHLERELECLELKVQDYKVIEQSRLETLKTVETTDILVTNYYLGDGSSGTTTASGYSISDFDVNDEGMYTWNGMIVIATAHESLGNVKDGFVTHELYDELVLTFNDTTYNAIVLDKCGACTYGYDSEDLQRYDVFTVNGGIGKVEGILHDYTK